MIEFNVNRFVSSTNRCKCDVLIYSIEKSKKKKNKESELGFCRMCVWYTWYLFGLWEYEKQWHLLLKCSQTTEVQRIWFENNIYTIIIRICRLYRCLFPLFCISSHLSLSLSSRVSLLGCLFFSSSSIRLNRKYVEIVVWTDFVIYLFFIFVWDVFVAVCVCFFLEFYVHVYLFICLFLFHFSSFDFILVSYTPSCVTFFLF